MRPIICAVSFLHKVKNKFYYTFFDDADGSGSKKKKKSPVVITGYPIKIILFHKESTTWR